MKRILIACLFVVGCKDKEAEKAPAPAETAPPSATAPSAPSAPSLPSARPQRPSLPPEAQQQDQWPRRERDPAAREERRKEREALLDTNKDGTVSPEERRERFRPMMNRLDENKDGKLTIDELGKAQGRLAFDDPKALDTDRNGDISLAELETAITARRDLMRENWRNRRGGSAGPD